MDKTLAGLLIGIALIIIVLTGINSFALVAQKSDIQSLRKPEPVVVQQPDPCKTFQDLRALSEPSFTAPLITANGNEVASLLVKAFNACVAQSRTDLGGP